jgi:hypothetical protein
MIWSGFRRLTRARVAAALSIVQFPNAGLIIAFLAGQVAGHVHGQGHADASAISYLTLTVWAYEELVHPIAPVVAGTAMCWCAR